MTVMGFAPNKWEEAQNKVFLQIFYYCINFPTFSYKQHTFIRYIQVLLIATSWKLNWWTYFKVVQVSANKCTRLTNRIWNYTINITYHIAWRPVRLVRCCFPTLINIMERWRFQYRSFFKTAPLSGDVNLFIRTLYQIVKCHSAGSQLSGSNSFSSSTTPACSINLHHVIHDNLSCIHDHWLIKW